MFFNIWEKNLGIWRKKTKDSSTFITKVSSFPSLMFYLNFGMYQTFFMFSFLNLGFLVVFWKWSLYLIIRFPFSIVSYECTSIDSYSVLFTY